MVLMIDNYDSFTYNIVQYCRELGADLRVIRNDEMSVDEIAELGAEKIILSPGPSTPDEAGVTLDVIERFAGELPIFGICLGHQSIAQAFGGDVIRAKNMMHGKTSQVKVTGESPIFETIPEEFRATRYHSLVVDPETLPERIVPVAVSTDDGEIMALQIRDLPLYGVQFHPESIMSEHGHTMLGNFLKL
ncbi:aminodeoxychorismate/anthranilate synthase component II [Nitratifractor sp.]|uniref:anthranilate synthase component II n=1 Tax=Nitratifractor sp. TaxID=2268144 RepID=UPI0025ED4F38|nr:aminodeoxychorismate/anthranilate synthase component II [Nitratifractor sp.]